MFTTTARRLALVAVILAATTTTVSRADAFPAPINPPSHSFPSSHSTPPSHSAVPNCPDDVANFASYLRAHGFTAQAAKNAARLTIPSCGAF